MLNFIKCYKSRMTGDFQVRFCERLAGETPACLLGDFPACAGRQVSAFSRMDGTSRVIAITPSFTKNAQSSAKNLMN